MKLKEIKRNWWKLLLIVIISSAINMGLHAVMTPDDIDNLSGLDFSYFVENNLVMQGIILWEFIAYTTFALIFMLIQDNFGGKKWQKGLRYGIAFGGLYFFGMLEAVMLINSSFLSELIMGLADALAFIIAGLLLGAVLGTDSPKSLTREDPKAIIYIALFYIIGRILAYTIWNVDSSFYTAFWPTMAWTVTQGIWIGCIYYLLSHGIESRSLFKHAFLFGGVVYGINWIINHSFMFVIVAFNFDLLIRSGNDALFVILGVYSYKKIMQYKEAGSEKETLQAHGYNKIVDV